MCLAAIRLLTGEPELRHRNARIILIGDFVENGEVDLSISRVHQLSYQPTPFVGRQNELSRIADLFAEPNCRLMTLLGAGGIGKTRLALQAAAAQHNHYRDGVYFVPLQASASVDLIVPAVIEAIGLQFPPGNEPLDQLLNYLSNKSLLLILDNFEHLLDGASLLSEILAVAPNIYLLVTSRERLNLVEEWVLEVDGLAFPADDSSIAEHYSAVELFVQQARHANVNFALTNENRAAVARICRLVGGMPLAIELAAAWVRSLSCEDIADEIARSLDILESSARNTEPRHRTMRTTLESTWNRLSESERKVFMCLPVFRGGFTRQAVEAIAGASFSILASLVDKSLLRVDVNGRYELHEVIHQYAQERLAASRGNAAAQIAHAAYYIHFLQQQWQPLRSAQQVAALNRIETEFENVRIAWRTIVQQRNATELSRAVHSLWYFVELRNRSDDRIALFSQAEEALRPLLGNPQVDRAIGQLLTARSWFLYKGLGEAQARALGETGLALLQRVGTPEDIALACFALCQVEAWAYNLTALQRNAEKMARIARALGDDWLLAGALFPLANVAAHVADLDEVARLVQMFVESSRACGDPDLQLMCLLVVQVKIAKRRGDYTEVRRLATEGLQLAQAIHSVYNVALAQTELALAALHLQEYSRAAEHFRQVLQIEIEFGYRSTTLQSIFYIAQLWVALGKTEQAVSLITLVLEAHDTMRKTGMEAEAQLAQLRSQLPPQAFANAQERGRLRDINTLAQELIEALAELTQSSEPPSPPICQEPVNPLNLREIEILRLVAEGFSNNEIAEQLFLARSTVKWYVRQIFRKLSVASRTQAVDHARVLGLVP